MLPSEPLKAVFDEEVMERLASVDSPSEELRYRLGVLTASGPEPSEGEARARLRPLRAQKGAWEAYLTAAFACGMFEGDQGEDLRGRLVGEHDGNFRSAIAECMTCWLLAGKLKHTVIPNPAGRKRHVLDFLVRHQDGDIRLEVKAPYRERPGTVWWGDDADIIARCLDDANKQFSAGYRNILALVPSLKAGVFTDRRQLIHALFGREAITFTVNTQTGAAVDEPRSEFVPNGSFLRTKREDGRNLKPDGTPKYTKVGAVLCIEERLMERHPYPFDMVFSDVLAGLSSNSESQRKEFKRRVELHYGKCNCMWIEHDVLVAHNPQARSAIPEDIWGDYAQLVRRGDQMVWTDGYKDI